MFRRCRNTNGGGKNGAIVSAVAVAAPVVSSAAVTICSRSNGHSKRQPPGKTRLLSRGVVAASPMPRPHRFPRSSIVRSFLPGGSIWQSWLVRVRSGAVSSTHPPLAFSVRAVVFSSFSFFLAAAFQTRPCDCLLLRACLSTAPPNRPCSLSPCPLPPLACTWPFPVLTVPPFRFEVAPHPRPAGRGPRPCLESSCSDSSRCRARKRGVRRGGCGRYRATPASSEQRQ